jgi:DNA-directed RNA polymerase specialized sigma24 family protein
VTNDAPSGYLEFASARGTQLFRVALLMCGDCYEAEDLVQTTLAKVFVAWTRVRRNAESYARRLWPMARRGTCEPVQSARRISAAARIPERRAPSM